MRAAKYLLGLFPLLIGAVVFTLGGWWSWFPMLLVFGIFPLIELVLPQSEENLDEELEKDLFRQRVYDFVVYATVPGQFALLFYFLYTITTRDLAAWEIAGMTTGMGISCGALGINAAHELGHRRKKYEQNMSKALLLTSLYMHFFIEHNRGHHAHVATEEDPASARYGETLFGFFPRTIIGSWMSAWRLENERLQKQGKSWFSLHNEMLRFQLIQVAFTAAIFAAFGWVGGVGFIGAAAMGALLLETINYVEHYGLSRKKLENGRYERVLPIHSWNSNHPIGRLLLFELSRHSDHHAQARRKYQVLRHFDHSPQAPTGYPGMIVLAWFPPLWFAVMHRHMDAEQARIRALGERSAIELEQEPLAA